MPTCAVHNCRNNRRHGFRLFRFPRGIERREVWKVNSGCFEMKPSSSLCEVCLFIKYKIFFTIYFKYYCWANIINQQFFIFYKI